MGLSSLITSQYIQSGLEAGWDIRRRSVTGDSNIILRYRSTSSFVPSLIENALSSFSSLPENPVICLSTPEILRITNHIPLSAPLAKTPKYSQILDDFSTTKRLFLRMPNHHVLSIHPGRTSVLKGFPTLSWILVITLLDQQFPPSGADYDS